MGWGVRMREGEGKICGVKTTKDMFFIFAYQGVCRPVYLAGHICKCVCLIFRCNGISSKYFLIWKHSMAMSYSFKFIPACILFCQTEAKENTSI